MVSLLSPVGRWWGDSIARRLYHPPRRSHHRTPADRGLEFRSEKVRTPDGIELDLWVIPGRGEDCAVVGHGIGLSKSASIAQAAILNDLGMTVVMFDHRNHGLSATDSARTGLAERFTLDVKTAVDFAKQTVGGGGITIVWGFSFSCFPSLFLLRDVSNGVDGLLCDSGPAASLRPLFYGFFATGVLPIPPGLRTGRARTAMVEQAIVRGTAMLDASWPPPATMGTLNSTPILLIAGTEDSIVPVGEMRAIAELYPHAEVVELVGDHLGAIKRNAEAYRKEVESFIDRIRTTRDQAVKVL